ncbi:hypothetical protein B0H14DRAFT_3142700 [Mycena olivaceomarginata]|nr:hypothetical protein B0H14DRAFT_3142700 [Mycena olivaceomarginata]
MSATTGERTKFRGLAHVQCPWWSNYTSANAEYGCRPVLTARRAARSPPPSRARATGTSDEFELGSAGEGDNAQSPPTSFEGEYDDEEAGSGAETAARHEAGREEDEDEDEDSDGGEEHYPDTPAPHPWYKPSVPVLLALAPPIGNWLTGGDHVKDLLLLLLVVFCLHQIVEAARPAPAP